VTYSPRSHYETGDPLEVALARQEARQLGHAGDRARRVLLMADSLVSVLDAGALLANADAVVAARRECFHVLADLLYGGPAVIDVPDFTDPASLERVRTGRREEERR